MEKEPHVSSRHTPMPKSEPKSEPKSPCLKSWHANVRGWGYLMVLLLPTTLLPAQWEIQNSNTHSSLRGIHALSGGVAWASGTGGTVLRTEDGGSLWQGCATPPGAEKLDFRGIQAFDSQTAIVMSSGPGDQSRLYKTTDGCHTWKLVFTNPDKDGFWDALSLSKVYGYLVGDPVNGTFAIFESTDGGDTWSRRIASKRGPHGEGCRLDEFPAKDKEASFAASNQALLGSFQYFAFVTGGSVARLAYTDHFDLDFALCHDSAKFIKLPLMQGSTSSGAFAIAAVQGQGFFPPRVMVVGGDFQHPNDAHRNALLIKSREGLHVPFTSYFDLVTPTTPPHGYRSAVTYDPTQNLWITVGPNGTDISRDDGRNWTALKPTPAEPPDPDQHWNALSLPFVVGPDGRIGKLRPSALTQPTSSHTAPSPPKKP